MNERRYRDEEVREIFKRATTDKGENLPPARSPTGLTLSEMQSIGLEVGIEPDVVARAAAALDVRPAPSQPVRKSLGMPVEVGLTVPLAKPMTDHQWEMLVGELRRVFRAQGKVTTLGTSREWRNGNLHASVEPTESGYRLRMGTIKGDAAGWNALGALGILGSLGTWIAHYVILDPTSAVAPIVAGAAGIGAFAVNWLRLPPWAREREAQMNQIAAKARAIMDEV